MKGYYENFCYEVYIVVIFLIEDSVMQKSILTYDEMLLNFFINTVANFTTGRLAYCSSGKRTHD